MIRVVNETNAIINWMFNNIKNDVFIDGFCDIFKNKNSHKVEELLCEKYFILLNYKIMGILNRQIAYSLIFNYKNKEKIFNIFEKKYNYYLTDFYNDTGKTYDVFNFDVVYDSNSIIGKIISNDKKNIEEQSKIINIYADKVKVLEYNINILQSSLSWKITKPLRIIKGMIRNEKN